MKVLHLSAGKMFGGVETFLLTLARERRLCAEMQPHFAVCFEERFSRELRASGVPVDYLGEVKVRNPLTVFRARAALDRLLAQEAVDVAICHLPWAHAVFAPVIRARGIRLVFFAHGFLRGRHWIEWWAKRTPPALAICNSRATRASIGSVFPGVASQVVTYPVSPHAAPAREPGATPVVIVQVSRMERWKGHLAHLEALAGMRDLEDWICWFVGGAQNHRELDYEAEVHRKCLELGLHDRVEFLGERDDVPDLLNQADIFCQPNLTPEPFGIVFIEALQSGLPVVATRMGAAEEILTPECGVLVPANDPAKLGEALRKLIVDPGLRASLSAAGPARAAALCDPATQLDRLKQVLQALL